MGRGRVSKPGAGRGGSGRRTAVLLMLAAGQAVVVGVGLPERASNGQVGLAQKHAHSTPGRGACAARRCFPGADGEMEPLRPEPEWGEIEQQCDHFTRATWTPEKKHMRHDMMREEGRRGRKAEGHVNAYSCRLKQRYWMHTGVWNRPVGPILLVVGGEHPLDGSVAGFVMDAAAELSAMVVVVEHRFFGTSIPEGWNATNGLSLLTMEQAVADLAVFRDKFQRMVLAPQGQSENVWITVGCGYAGALATWARTKHPHHFAGAWASSPPLAAAVEFPSHDMHDRQTVGEHCAARIRTLTDIVQIELNNMGAEGEVRLKALLQAPEEVDNRDVMLIVHDSISLAIQYGFKSRLCSTLGAAHDDEIVADFANLTATLWGRSYGKSCHFDSACLSSVQKGLSSARAWHWILCTQLGLFATTPRSEEDLGIRHKGLDAPFFMRRCVAAFGKGTRADPHGPRKTFKGSGSKRLLIVTARDDPWKLAGHAPHILPDEIIEVDCHECGHCFDMLPPAAADEEQVREARAKIVRHLRAWTDSGQ